MNIIPEIEDYDSTIQALEKSFSYAVEDMGLSPAQALHYADENIIPSIYEPFESFVVLYLALLSVGYRHGVILNRDNEDGEYILDEVGRKYAGCKDALLAMIDSSPETNIRLKYDLEKIIELYGDKF